MESEQPKELKIENTQKFATLEQAITEGGNGLIPYEFDYPNTDLTVEVKLKPLTNPELDSAAQSSKITGNTVDIEILSFALFNTDGSNFGTDLLIKLPAGVVLELVYKIMEISGFDINKLNELKSDIGDIAGF